MRVVQLLYSGLGGHAAVAFALAHASEPLGWNNGMVFIGIEDAASSHLATCERQQYPYVAVRTSAGRPWLAWPRIYAALSRLRPDAIVLHSVKTVVPCALYARLHGVPLLAVEHQANALKRRAEWFASAWVMRLADAVFVLTPAYRDELRLRLGRRWREGKVDVVPNGVEIPAHVHDAARLAAASFRIGMAARITSIKRHELLIDALALLRDRDGDSAWRLSLAGDGSAVPGLRAHIAALDLEHVVELPGFLDERAMSGWFADLDAYAHASDGETLSTSLLQAMALGLPIVGSAVPGIADLLAEGGGVGLAVPQSAQAFADALARLRDDAALRVSLGERARARAKEHYGRQAMAARYDERLRTLCAR